MASDTARPNPITMYLLEQKLQHASIYRSIFHIDRRIRFW